LVLAKIALFPRLEQPRESIYNQSKEKAAEWMNSGFEAKINTCPNLPAYPGLMIY
jgi:hypothetical protein